MGQEVGAAFLSSFLSSPHDSPDTIRDADSLGADQTHAMAQAVFDEHPLQQYLREAGETQECMPGTYPGLAQELEPISPSLPIDDAEDDTTEYDWNWRSDLLNQLLQSIESLIPTVQLTKYTNPLVECFKYNVISSSLLSPDLTPPHTSRSTPQPIPGDLHSRSSSEASQHPVAPRSYHPGEEHYGLLSGLVLVFSVLLSAGFTSLALLTLWAGLVGIYYLRLQSQVTKVDLLPCLDSLNELISINNEWEAVVQEAISIFENDDLNAGLSSHSSSHSSLRIALHSTLQTTQTQCDNVRHLLSALTSPSDLSQLSEMYAPPSPIKATYSFLDTHSRQSSFPSHRRQQTASISSATTIFTDQKRMTWNGAYSGTPYSSPSPTSVVRIRRRHRSEIPTFLGASSSFSAPVTPTPSSPLARVSEKAETARESALLDSQSHDGGSFGADALKLQHGRTSNGLEVLSLPSTSGPSLPPSYAQSSIPVSPRGAIMPSPSSRFTTMHTSRQALLSSSALNHALQAAMGAKRYACSHLLALRFEEREDGGYWEDVKSVMELLIGALSDAGARLREAVGEIEVQKLRDQTPTPCGSESGSPGRNIGHKLSGSGGVVGVEGKGVREKRKKRLSEMVVSFAPMPSHLNKFAAHVAAIQGALEDARSYLEVCVRALKEGSREGKLPKLGQAPDTSMEGEGDHPALRAYERLRRELGFALRECERGRNRLLDLVQPPIPFGVEDEEDSEGVPGLGHDSLSEESDKVDVLSPLHAEEDGMDGGMKKKNSVSVVGGDEPFQGVIPDVVDDASRHLLMSVDVGHLPPAHSGVEQVFEADTSLAGEAGGGDQVEGAKREKSKLSREERIKLVKERRESGLEPSPNIRSVSGGHEEKWGPGGEVVQELKDVIWKVGERRRKVQETQGDEVEPLSSPWVRSRNSLPSSVDTPSSPPMRPIGFVSPPPRMSSLLARSPEDSPLGRSSWTSPSASPSMRALFESLQRELPVVRDGGEGEDVLSTGD